MRAPVLAVGGRGRWDSGGRSGRCFRTPGNSGAGSTSNAMYLLHFQNRRIRGGVGGDEGDYWGPRTSTRRGWRSRRSSGTTGAKYPKAVAKIVDDADVLLEYFRYPAEHWVHLRTTNPIESTFATVRLRTRVTKGPGSRAAGDGDGLQADRSGPVAVAGGQRPPTVGGVGASGRAVPQGQAPRTTGRDHPRNPRPTPRCPRLPDDPRSTGFDYSSQS